MARLENEDKKDGKLEEMQEEIARLKKDLKHKQSKKFFNCGTCLLIVLFFLLILGTFGAYVLAKSGLVQIPVFTGYFYSRQSFNHEVKSVNIDQNALLKRLATIASQEALKQKTTQDVAISADLSEGELTGLLNNIKQNNEKLKSKIEFWQLGVVDDSLEFYMVTKNYRNAVITINFKPEVKDGKLKFNVNNFKLGALTLPDFFGNLLIESIGGNVVNGFIGSVSSLAQLQEINLAPGKATIKMLINNLINLKNAI